MSEPSGSLEITVLGSGSKGNATLVRYGDWAVLIDAGFSGKELCRRLAIAGAQAEEVRAVLVTHEHIDHVRGLKRFCKLSGCGVWANGLTAMQLQSDGRTETRMTVFANGSPFELGPITVEALSVSHDAVDPVGFLVRVGDRRAAVITDLGWSGKMVPLKIRDCAAMVIESNHCSDLLRKSARPARLQQRIQGRRGHLSNAAAAELLTQSVGPQTRHVVLAHLSEDCNRPELAVDTASAALRKISRDDVSIVAASQSDVSATIRV